LSLGRPPPAVILSGAKNLWLFLAGPIQGCFASLNMTLFDKELGDKAQYGGNIR